MNHAKLQLNLTASQCHFCCMKKSNTDISITDFEFHREKKMCNPIGLMYYKSPCSLVISDSDCCVLAPKMLHYDKHGTFLSGK